MRYPILVFAALAAFGICPDRASAVSVPLGTAGRFAVLAGTTVTNTGPTVVNGGDVGVSPGSAITGFPPGAVVPPYVLHAADAVSLKAQSDLTVAYDAAAERLPSVEAPPADHVPIPSLSICRRTFA